MSKRAGKGALLLVILLAVAGGLVWWTLARGTESTEDAAIEAAIIPIAPKVPGYVTELNVDDNQMVKQGDVLLRIDPRDYEIALEQARAELDSARSKLEAAQYTHTTTSVSAPSDLVSAKAQVAAATAEWKNKKDALSRQQRLDDRARSRQSLENAIAEEKSARSNLEEAKARLASAETAPDKVAASQASVKELEAEVSKAQAALEMAKKNLNDTVLKAPQDGRVTRRNVEQGAFVSTGQKLFSLVGTQVWVVANFKETQLTHMKPGQSVDISIDAYPGHDFKGTIESLQAGTGARFSLFPPENATGNFVKVVQRVPVKILFDEAPGEEFAIGPGMSVVPTVHLQ